MGFEGFDSKKTDEYSAKAKALYGKTDAYKEFTQNLQAVPPNRKRTWVLR